MLQLLIPKNIELSCFENWIYIKGPLGVIKKKKPIDLDLNINVVQNLIKLPNTKLNQFFLISLKKIMYGVLKGYYQKLVIVGVGYKVNCLNNKILQLKIGKSHFIYYQIPSEIKIIISSQKVLTLIVFGNDLNKVTQVSADIKNIKPVEPYKGKGIKFVGEIIRKKEGKKANV